MSTTARPMPRAAAEILNRTIEQEWGQDLIKSWNSAGWFDMPLQVGDRVGALIGASPGQTVVCDTTSINLYKAVHAAIGLRPGRNVVIAEAASFPTDLYIIEGAMASAGRPMQRRLVASASSVRPWRWRMPARLFKLSACSCRNDCCSPS